LTDDLAFNCVKQRHQLFLKLCCGVGLIRFHGLPEVVSVAG
jgi:hypothetical protein